MTQMRPILIAGPTASGKSALALKLARERGGVIVNADSMQVYDELQILSARPSPEETAEVPHRLYGHVPMREGYSVGRFVREAEAVLAELKGEGRLPIFVGGTGLYMKALLEGLSPIPAIPAGDPRTLAGGGGPAWRIKTASQTRGSRSRDCGAAEPDRSAAHRAGAGGVRGHRAAALGVAERAGESRC